METIKRSQPWAADSAFQMIDVAPKTPTHRRAIARGTIHLAPDAYAALAAGTNPKGDVLKLAEITGIQAAKKTSDLLPLCHPLPLEKVRMGFEQNAQLHTVTVFCEVATTGKTGVEMEALAGVNGALLAIYDLSKAVNPVLSISEIRLDRKEGGKHGVWTHPELKTEVEPSARSSRTLAGIHCAVLTVSDRCSRGEAEDRSGPEIVNYLKTRAAEILGHTTVADDPAEIRAKVLNWVEDQRIELIVTTGGTGLGPRDLTPEALQTLWTRKLPGFGELLRSHGSRQTEMSWLSRSEAGLMGRTLVIALPGSARAVTDGLQALEHLIPHAIQIARGGAH